MGQDSIVPGTLETCPAVNLRTEIQKPTQARVGCYRRRRCLRRLSTAAITARATTATQIDAAINSDKTSWDISLATPKSERPIVAHEFQTNSPSTEVNGKLISTVSGKLGIPGGSRK